MTDRVIIFDTTLRDGEQSPGASMNTAEKLRLAVQLEKLGIDILEAGFPAASDGDLEAVSRIAGKLERTEIAALAAQPKTISIGPGRLSATRPNQGSTPLSPRPISIWNTN